VVGLSGQKTLAIVQRYTEQIDKTKNAKIAAEATEQMLKMGTHEK